MNQIKVYLQYPWRFPDSPYYKYLIESPPEGIKFQNITNQKGVITNKNFLWFSNFLKKEIRRWTNKFKLRIPNAHLSPKGDYDLIHCAHCLSKNKDTPWILDVEHYFQLFISGTESKKAKEKVEKILRAKNFKFLIAWTEEAKRGLIKSFPSIEDKIKVVYPAIPKLDFKKKKHKNIKIIFSGRYFYEKGGLHALDAIDKLTKKYPFIRGIINSNVPKDILKKYSENKKLEFYSLIPQNKLFELYQNSNILIYPGYSDSFGFAYLEAMGFGLPVITVKGGFSSSIEEIIENGRTGYIISPKKKIDIPQMKIIEKEIIDKIIQRTSKLIENKKLLESMSKNCLKEVRYGKFSIKRRNKQLRKIYEEALNEN